ncbi:MAG: sensor domain-containing diguanylate cyclase [Gammaproteobacteria bacterium]|nr:sensor domain-containing diguanylate cyclase [Gammaproteobacteria bacterium]
MKSLTRSHLFAFLLGALLLSTVAALQLWLVLGVVKPIGFIIPFLIGGFAGLILYHQFHKNKIYQKHLEEKNQRLELVLQATGLGFWDWYPKTNQVIYDARWAEMLGFRLDEIEQSQQTWKSRVHPDDLQQCYQDIQAHIDGKTEFYSNIHRMLHKNGHWIYILDRGKVVERDANGEPVRFSGTHSDITALKRIESELQTKTENLEHVNRQLKQLSVTDGLTKMHNRRAFEQRMQEEWQRCKRTSTPFSVLMIDTDFFKNYNDGYGHLAGDECLKKIALQLKKAARRQNDFAARYGGEEFVIILPEDTLEEAYEVAESIRTTIENLQIPHAYSEISKVVTISIGVAQSEFSTDEDYQTLISAADKALYLAKSQGRNRCEKYPLLENTPEID